MPTEDEIQEFRRHLIDSQTCQGVVFLAFSLFLLECNTLLATVRYALSEFYCLFAAFGHPQNMHFARFALGGQFPHLLANTLPRHPHAHAFFFSA